MGRQHQRQRRHHARRQIGQEDRPHPTQRSRLGCKSQRNNPPRDRPRNQPCECREISAQIRNPQRMLAARANQFIRFGRHFSRRHHRATARTLPRRHPSPPQNQRVSLAPSSITENSTRCRKGSIRSARTFTRSPNRNLRLAPPPRREPRYGSQTIE
jgi:hypothetical protein